MKLDRYQQNKNKLVFGWAKKTHYEISTSLVSKYNCFLPKNVKVDIAAFQKACVAPDSNKEHMNFAINYSGHSLNIDKLKNDPPDAYNLALFYSKKALKAETAEERDDMFGRALHYVLDCLCPAHNAKKFNSDKHLKFEELALKFDYDDYKSEKRTVSEEFFQGNFFTDSIRKAKAYYKIFDKGLRKDEVLMLCSLKNAVQTADIYVCEMMNKFKQGKKY